MKDKSDTNRLGSALQKIGRSSSNHPWVVLVAVLLIVSVALFGILNLQLSMGMELYLEDDSETIQNWDEVQKDFNTGNVLFAVVETDSNTDIFDPEVIREINSLTEEYSKKITATSGVTSYTQILSQNGNLPESRSQAISGLEKAQSSSERTEKILGNLVPDYGSGNSTAIIQIQYGEAEIPNDADNLYGFMPPSEGEIVIDETKEVTDSANLSDNVDITITGGPVFEQAAFGLMLPEMITLFSIAFAVILVSMVLIMRGRLRKTRRVILPLISTIVALLMMMGMMGYTGFNFNAIMLGVMPVALGLGIDYGLQIQTRYIEERRSGKMPVDAAGTATSTAGRSLSLALGTTLVGLGSLLVADVPPVRQFGITASFSVISSMVLSLTFLVVLLVLFDSGTSTEGDSTDTTDDSGRGIIESALHRFSISISRHPFTTMILFLLLISGGLFAYPMVDTQNDMFDFWPDIQEKDDLEQLEESVDSPNIVYVIAEGDQIYNNTYELSSITKFESEIKDVERISTTISPVSAVRMQGNTISEDPATRKEQFNAVQDVDIPPVGLQNFDETPNRVLIQVYVSEVSGDEEAEVISDINSVAEETMPGIETRTTGNIVINRNVIENVTAGLTSTTVISFGVGLVFLAIALRSIRESTVLVGSVATSTMALVAGGMYIIGVPWNPLTVTTASIVFGVGITYGIHIFERYREELLVSGSTPKDSIVRAVTAKSVPVLGSGATTMLGFGVLIISEFPVLSNFGLAISLAMGLSLIVAFILMPAVLVILTKYNLILNEEKND